MRFMFFPRLLPAAALLLAGLPAPSRALSELSTPPSLLKPLGPGEAALVLGGYPVLRLSGAAGGLDPDRRVAAITDRLTPLLGSPKILPSDVVVFLPDPKSRVNRDPVVYVLGRKIVTVDPATAKAAPGAAKTPLQVAKLWAARLQQVLPRVNWRPSNAPEPNVPAAPPLLVTHDFAKVGRQAAFATLRGKTVLVLRGPQPGGQTPAERADLLTSRLAFLANRPEASAPNAVQVLLLGGGSATLSLAGTPLLTVTAHEARAAGASSPVLLAQGWAKNLRAILTPPAAAAPTETVPASPAPSPAPADPVPPAAAPPAPAAPPAAGG